MFEVREFTDKATWDSFVEASPQGSIFSTTKWLDLIGQPYHIWGVYKGNELVGGAANFDKPAPLTPFQGIIGSSKVVEALLNYLPDEFYNSPEVKDIRPFKWAGWSVNVGYTYVVDLTDIKKAWQNMEKQTRYNVHHVEDDYNVAQVDDFEGLDKLYSQTFERKGLERPVSSQLLKRLYVEFKPELYMSWNEEMIASAVVIIKDSKRAYYIVGASSRGGTSSMTLWYAFQELYKQNVKEIDLVGCNDKKIANFKKGFGGVLMPYYGVKRC